MGYPFSQVCRWKIETITKSCSVLLLLDPLYRLAASTQWWELFKILLLKIHVVCGVDFNNILSATIVLLVVILSAANRSIKFWLHDTAVMCSDRGCPIENWKCRNPAFFTKGWLKVFAYFGDIQSWACVYFKWLDCPLTWIWTILSE